MERWSSFQLECFKLGAHNLSIVTMVESIEMHILHCCTVLFISLHFDNSKELLQRGENIWKLFKFSVGAICVRWIFRNNFLREENLKQLTLGCDSFKIQFKLEMTELFGSTLIDFNLCNQINLWMLLTQRYQHGLNNLSARSNMNEVKFLRGLYLQTVTVANIVKSKK